MSVGQTIKSAAYTRDETTCIQQTNICWSLYVVIVVHNKIKINKIQNIIQLKINFHFQFICITKRFWHISLYWYTS